MSDNSEPTATTPRPRPGDIGRRVRMRRKELGLSCEQVAARAGMAPGYVHYVEEQPALVDTGGLIRLAGALETTVSELRGGRVDIPPGQAGAAARPALEELSPEECRARLSTRGIGRVALLTEEGPAVFPVNNAVDDETIVYRTTPASAPANAAGKEIAFEVDQVDDALSQGWSVLVTGRAEQLSDPDTIHRLSSAAGPQPWAGGERKLWIRIVPTRITGRLIRAV